GRLKKLSDGLCAAEAGCTAPQCTRFRFAANRRQTVRTSKAKGRLKAGLQQSANRLPVVSDGLPFIPETNTLIDSNY
ncbi:hypothetical protein, partial [Neisseria sp. oral taxon 020]|uniref:hypothetical protein n=1 Tax=Neisseria sp. oral taxon 020 TaxID=712401 RepID=UPI001E398A7C